MISCEESDKDKSHQYKTQDSSHLSKCVEAGVEYEVEADQPKQVVWPAQSMFGGFLWIFKGCSFFGNRLCVATGPATLRGL